MTCFQLLIRTINLEHEIKILFMFQKHSSSSDCKGYWIMFKCTIYKSDKIIKGNMV